MNIQVRNPKSETRNPKEIRDPKSELRIGTTFEPFDAFSCEQGPDQATLVLSLSGFDLRISDFLRPSNFGFRISGWLP